MSIGTHLKFNKGVDKKDLLIRALLAEKNVRAEMPCRREAKRESSRLGSKSSLLSNSDPAYKWC